jgi:hypothetical protein
MFISRSLPSNESTRYSVSVSASSGSDVVHYVINRNWQDYALDTIRTEVTIAEIPLDITRILFHCLPVQVVK